MSESFLTATFRKAAFRASRQRIVSLALLLTGTTRLAPAQESNYQVDAEQSSVTFTLADVLHTVRGTFRLKQGDLEVKADGRASGQIDVDAASGDSGIGVDIYPGSSPNVVSVGGTFFNRDNNGNFISEQYASGGGGGDTVKLERRNQSLGLVPFTPLWNSLYSKSPASTTPPASENAFKAVVAPLIACTTPGYLVPVSVISTFSVPEGAVFDPLKYLNVKSKTA